MKIKCCSTYMRNFFLGIKTACWLHKVRWWIWQCNTAWLLQCWTLPSQIIRSRIELGLWWWWLWSLPEPRPSQDPDWSSLPEFLPGLCFFSVSAVKMLRKCLFKSHHQLLPWIPAAIKFQRWCVFKMGRCMEGADLVAANGGWNWTCLIQKGNDSVSWNKQWNLAVIKGKKSDLNKLVWGELGRLVVVGLEFQLSTTSYFIT